LIAEDVNQCRRFLQLRYPPNDTLPTPPLAVRTTGVGAFTLLRTHSPEGLPMPTTRLAAANDVGLNAPPAAQFAMAVAVFASKVRSRKGRRRGQPEVAIVDPGAGYRLRGHDRIRHRRRGRRVADLVAPDGGTREVRVGVEGVGLCRTELAYLEWAAAATTADLEQEEIGLMDLLAGRHLVARTFDFGADKVVPFIADYGSSHPALGASGLRLAREHPQLLEDQLSAGFVERVRAPTGPATPIEVGVMVAVPSAVPAQASVAAAALIGAR